MSNTNELTRREFLMSGGALSGSAFARIAAPSLAAIVQSACSAKTEGAAFRVLEPREAVDFAAIAARIIPTTDTPGATEAGVIRFLDNAFAAEMQGELAAARVGLDDLNSSVAASHGGDRSFSDLAADEQDEMLMAIERGAFFGLMREMTVFGFFAMSSYGGNRDHVGWELIGFKGHHGAWQYPFGHYDAEVHAESEDAG